MNTIHVPSPFPHLKIPGFPPPLFCVWRLEFWIIITKSANQGLIWEILDYTIFLASSSLVTFLSRRMNKPQGVIATPKYYKIIHLTLQPSDLFPFIRYLSSGCMWINISEWLYVVWYWRFSHVGTSQGQLFCFSRRFKSRWWILSRCTYKKVQGISKPQVEQVSEEELTLVVASLIKEKYTFEYHDPYDQILWPWDHGRLLSI